jgi:hypothetical protein
VLLPDRYVLDAKVLDGDKYVVPNGPASSTPSSDRLTDNVIEFAFSFGLLNSVGSLDKLAVTNATWMKSVPRDIEYPTHPNG